MNQDQIKTSTELSLNTAYLELAQNWSLWDTPQDYALQRITEVVSHSLNAARVSIWLSNESLTQLELADLYVQKSQQHSQGQCLKQQEYPNYFAALLDNRVISAVDAHTDYRTREFSSSYLTPQGIDSMLDATLRKAGQMAGVLCIEHMGGQRLWNDHEKRFAISVADLVSQRLIYEGIRNNEAHFRELNAIYQASFDSANYGIISSSIDGTINTFNQAACNMLGYSKEEMLGKHTPVMFHDFDEVSQRAQELSEELGETIEPGYEVFVTKARRGIVEEREWTYIRKDGSRFPVLLSVTPVRDSDGELIGFLGIVIDITDRVLSKRALREEEKRYRLLFEGSGDSIFLMKEDLFVDCNSATLEMYGCSREQIIQQTPYRYSPEYQPDGRPSQDKALEKIIAAFSGETQFFEWRHLKYDGTPFDAEVTLNVIEIEGESHLLATVRDISERKQAELALENSRQQLLLQNENLELINQLSTRLHGSRSNEKIIRETLGLLLQLSDTPQVAIYLLDNPDSDYLTLADSNGFKNDTLQIGKHLPLENSLSGLALKAGHLLTCPDFATDQRLNPEVQKATVAEGIKSGVAIPLIYHGKPLGSLNLVYQKTREFSQLEQETMETIGKTMSLALANAQHMHEMEYMAHHDSLTGLANRSWLHKAFENQITKPALKSANLFLLDLDRFKEINDTLGHHIGDKLLQQIGPRIKQSMQDHHTLICRLGGDEFTVLIEDGLDQEAATTLAHQLLDTLRMPFSIDDTILEIDASIGIACYPQDGTNSHALLRSADVAMYDAKHRGGGVSLYNAQKDIHTPERLALMAELGNAIRENQLVLHYQPKVQLRSGEVTSFEALVRWQHPEMGLLYPDKFIPLAEMSDAIHQLTENVLEQALARQQAWRKDGHNYSVSVNLSARNLIDDRCVSKLAQLLEQYKTPAGKLEMEITETALMHDPDGAVELLNRISRLGVKLSIDDFGTGYSSLSYLRRLPIDALKIDREFVTDMLSNEQDAIIVRPTIALAHNLNLKVIAEGIEDEPTLQSLSHMACDTAQGYYISKPLDWNDMARWLEENENFL
jgi:diguanylate cyclase (GGDEF)-like protein/PAS domain S-box-containing protein